MPVFKYSARDADGTAVTGELDASSRKAALQRLAVLRLRPVSVGEASGSGSGGAKGGSRTLKELLLSPVGSGEIKLGRDVAMPFLVTLKELLGCGIQPGDALQLMSTRLNDPKQKLLAVRLWDEVRQGRSLSDAFRRQSMIFDDGVVSLMEAGEATGSLNNVLGRLVSSMEESKAIRSRLISALAYPAFLILVAFGLVLMFLFFLLPRIQDLLMSLGGKLPGSTKLLIFLAESALSYGWIAVIGIVAGVSSLAAWRRTPKGRLSFDTQLLRAPLLGRFMLELQVLRFSQVLSLLLENGITMVQSLAMAERSLGNAAMRVRFAEARSKVTEGVTLSTAFRGTGYFEGMALDIFTVGESTGNVVPGLKQMARQYGERVDATIKAFLGIVSVGVLLFVFSFVGLVAMGIISAVLTLSQSLSG